MSLFSEQILYASYIAKSNSYSWAIPTNSTVSYSNFWATLTRDATLSNNVTNQLTFVMSGGHTPPEPPKWYQTILGRIVLCAVIAGVPMFIIFILVVWQTRLFGICKRVNYMQLRDDRSDVPE